MKNRLVNTNVVKKKKLLNISEKVPTSKGVEMAVKHSRTETIMSVTNLSGFLQTVRTSDGQETCKVFFRLDPKSEDILVMPCSRGSFHNSISEGSQVTFNLQKKLCNKNKTEVKFGIVPGKHKSGGQDDCKKNEKDTAGPTKDLSKIMPSSSHDDAEKLDFTPGFVKRKQKSESLEDKEKTKANSSAQPISDQVDVDKDAVLSKELVVTKLVFALLAKLPDQAQYNVSKLY